MNQQEIKPVAYIAQYEHNGKLMPATKVLNDDQDVAFNPTFVAGSIICLYESFLSHVPEKHQNEFEETFKHAMNVFFKEKDLLIEKEQLN